MDKAKKGDKYYYFGDKWFKLDLVTDKKTIKKYWEYDKGNKWPKSNIFPIEMNNDWYELDKTKPLTDPEILNYIYEEYIAEVVRERDKHICQYCNKTEEQEMIDNKTKLGVYHLNHRQRDWRVENLSAICYTCFRTIEDKRHLSIGVLAGLSKMSREQANAFFDKEYDLEWEEEPEYNAEAIYKKFKLEIKIREEQMKKEKKDSKNLDWLMDKVQEFIEYSWKNDRIVEFVGSFAVMDKKKDFEVVEDRLLAYGSKEGLLIQLEPLLEELKKEKKKFVNW